MRKYESVIVFDPHLKEGLLASEIQKVTDSLIKHGAIDIKVSDWGRKDLAYPRKKRTVGIYRGFEYIGKEGNLVDKLTGDLRINESILLFQTHRTDEKLRRFKGNPKYSGLSLNDDFDDIDDIEDEDI
jgi:small subunit ribosomal protein S6